MADNFAAPDDPTVTWNSGTVKLRWRRMFFGRPVLQQLWQGERLVNGKVVGVKGWRDVEIVTE